MSAISGNECYFTFSPFKYFKQGNKKKNKKIKRKRKQMLAHIVCESRKEGKKKCCQNYKKRKEKEKKYIMRGCKRIPDRGNKYGYKSLVGMKYV